MDIELENLRKENEQLKLKLFDLEDHKKNMVSFHLYLLENNIELNSDNLCRFVDQYYEDFVKNFDKESFIHNSIKKIIIEDENIIKAYWSHDFTYFVLLKNDDDRSFYRKTRKFDFILPNIYIQKIISEHLSEYEEVCNEIIK
jgi:hypothetical protein